MKFFAVLSVLVVAGARANADQVNPLGRIIELMDSLTAKLVADGDSEDKAFHQYAEWCDETAANQQYTIDTATTKSTITKAASDIEASEGTIDDLSGKIAKDAELSQKQSAGTASAAADFGRNVLTSSDPAEKQNNFSADGLTSSTWGGWAVYAGSEDRGSLTGLDDRLDDLKALCQRQFGCDVDEDEGDSLFVTKWLVTVGRGMLMGMQGRLEDPKALYPRNFGLNADEEGDESPSEDADGTKWQVTGDRGVLTMLEDETSGAPGRGRGRGRKAAAGAAAAAVGAVAAAAGVADAAAAAGAGGGGAAGAADASAGAAAAGAADASEADSGVGPAELEKWLRIKKRAGYCGLCKGVFRDFTGHCSRRAPCKQHPESGRLTPQEIEQVRQEFVEELANPTIAKEKKVAAAKTRHEAAWEPPEAPAADPEYRFDFGFHSGKTLKTVLEKDPGYINRLMAWKNNILDQKLTLRNALEKEGLLEALLAKRPALMVARAKKMLSKVAEDAGKPLHPEIAKLRIAQHIEATDILATHSKDAAVAALAPPPQSRGTKRNRGGKAKSSKARTLLPHCSSCGSIHHKRRQCPHKQLQGKVVEDNRTQAVVDYLKDKRAAAIAGRLKYTPIEIRTQAYEERAKKMTRAPLHIDFLTMSRFSPSELVKYLVSVGVLQDLKGAPCPREKCHASSKTSWVSGADKVLGPVCFNDEAGPDIVRRTAWHRCGVCRERQMVSCGNPLFADFFGPGSKGVTQVVLAWWNAVEGISETATARQLNLHEGVVAGYYRRARSIMSFGAHRRQKDIQWGTGTDAAVEVEIDATVVCKWRDVVGDELEYSYYCYIGMRQRGSTSHFAIMPLGVSTSTGEGRVAPESSDAYHEFCRQILGDKKYNLLSMTDGSKAYQCRCAECSQWFEVHESVNHSRQPKPELSRPIKVVRYVGSPEQRDGMAGTMTIDKEWDLLKQGLPRNLAGRTVDDIERTDEHVRAQQWRRLVGNDDRWVAFVEEAARWSRAADSRRALQAGGHAGAAAGAGSAAGPPGAGPEPLPPPPPAPPAADPEAPSREPAPEGAASGGPAATAAEGAALAGQATRGQGGAPWSPGTVGGSPEPLPVPPPPDMQQPMKAYGDRYFESQTFGFHCGMHALNNLMGGPQFNESDLSDACSLVLGELATDVGFDEDRSLHQLPNGWYSHSVLAKAFDMLRPPTWIMQLTAATYKDWSKFGDPSVKGCLVNLNNTHWAAIVHHNDCVFYIDSCALPRFLDRKGYCQIISRNPLSFFVVTHDYE